MGAGESGTEACVIWVFGALECMECIWGASVSLRVVVIYGSKVMKKMINCCCRGTRWWWGVRPGRLLLLWSGNMAVYRFSHKWSGDSLYGLGLCSSQKGGLWYVAGVRGLWFWVSCGVPHEDVWLDWMDVFPKSVASLALGFDVIAAWGWGLVDDGAGDVCAWGIGRVLPGQGQAVTGVCIVALSKYSFWVFFFMIKWFQTAFILVGLVACLGSLSFCCVSFP